MDCLFCKIVAGEIPAQIDYQDDRVLAFADINPKAPVHLLIIPRQHIATVDVLTDEQEGLVGHMVLTAQRLAREKEIAASGYRVVMNCNADGGQEVFHLHLHLIGGKALSWPPGC
jgi:histidine triad (HIT) family protein